MWPIVGRRIPMFRLGSSCNWRLPHSRRHANQLRRATTFAPVVVDDSDQFAEVSIVTSTRQKLCVQIVPNVPADTVRRDSTRHDR